jgi:DNA-binding transcriptional regulator YhcF (GntR family)
MAFKIKIDRNSSVPKYEQVIDGIIGLIQTKQLKVGDKLPSLNEICKEFNLSKDTVLVAYNELKSRGIIHPKHGKGFYVSSSSVRSKIRIFVFFDVMNGYKEILYQSLINTLGPQYKIDIFFHHYNKKLFEDLIISKLNKYGHYVIMPHFNEDVSGIVKKIPKDKLMIIDKDIPSLKSGYAAVFQNFEKDVYGVLINCQSLLKKYKRLKLIADTHFQFIPDGILAGFSKFCREFRITGRIFDNLKSAKIEKGDAFIVFPDHDLISILKQIEERGWSLGKEIGILSYDETPLKEILAGGITVISTDFVLMGKTAAEMIKNGIYGKIENPYLFIMRNSL